MITSQKPALPSEIQDWKAKIPARALFYFRARLRQRFYAYLLSKFTELEKSQNLKKAELARRINKKNEQITRWLGGPNNLELDTISDLLLGMKAELWFTGRELDDHIITRELELWVSGVLNDLFGEHSAKKQAQRTPLPPAHNGDNLIRVSSVPLGASAQAGAALAAITPQPPAEEPSDYSRPKPADAARAARYEVEIRP